jgi:hypothetical protein
VLLKATIDSQSQLEEGNMTTNGLAHSVQLQNSATAGPGIILPGWRCSDSVCQVDKSVDDWINSHVIKSKVLLKGLLVNVFVFRSAFRSAVDEPLP